MTQRVFRGAVVLAALLTLGIVGSSSATEDHVICSDGGHFVYHSSEGETPTFEGLTFIMASGPERHYVSGAPLTESGYFAIVSQDTRDVPQGWLLHLSHCEDDGIEASPTPVPSSDPTPASSPSASPTSSIGTAETATPTPTPDAPVDEVPNTAQAVPEISLLAFLGALFIALATYLLVRALGDSSVQRRRGR